MQNAHRCTAARSEIAFLTEVHGHPTLGLLNISTTVGIAVQNARNATYCCALHGSVRNVAALYGVFCCRGRHSQAMTVTLKNVGRIREHFPPCPFVHCASLCVSAEPRIMIAISPLEVTGDQQGAAAAQERVGSRKGCLGVEWC